MAPLPPLVKLIQSSPCGPSRHRDFLYRYSIFVLTFLFYMSYHLSRKPISIAKGALHHNCSGSLHKDTVWYGTQSASLLLEHAPRPQVSNPRQSNTTCDWPPFDKSNYDTLFGGLDYAFLFAYAIGMFFSGFIGERIPLRYFLGFGMIGSGIFTSMFGMGYFWNIHVYGYFVVAQVINGIFQTTGWPGVVTAMGRWFGKGNRGLIMGVWNSHTSVGNILGSVIAALFVNSAWGWSFVVPGIIIGSMGLLCLLTLIEDPSDIGCSLPGNDSNQNVAYASLPTDDHENLDESTSKTAYDPNLNRGPIKSHKISDDEHDWSEAGNKEAAQPISFLRALNIPGVVEFSLCLFFSKLVNYTFLFWLPMYIQNNSNLSTRDSGLMSTLFDIGGIVGGITAGFVSDKTKSRATTSAVMLVFGAIMMFIYNTFGSRSHATSAALLFVTGLFVNGPYALITTAVSADLGTHKVLKGNAKALSTVTAIIDGTGSIGAALGPLFTGLISPTGWQNVFYMLIASNIAALLLLVRLIAAEINQMRVKFQSSERTGLLHRENED